MKYSLFLIILFSFVLQACASLEPLHVQLKYVPGDSQKLFREKGGEKVKLLIAKLDISDNRVDKEHLGSTDLPVYGSGISDWVREGILSLSEYGYLFPQTNTAVNPSGLSLKVNVNRASCRGSLMHMRCTVFMEVEYFSDGKFIQKVPYYGAEMADRSIFVGTSHFHEDSILQCLNSALDQCLVKIEGDLRKLSTGHGVSDSHETVRGSSNSSLQQ